MDSTFKRPGSVDLTGAPDAGRRLGRDIEKAGKADCRDAHRAAGLLPLVQLAIDAVRKDGGCKW